MKINKNMLYSFIILFTGGAIFYLIKNWLILPAMGIIWFSFEYFATKAKIVKLALALGIFLFVFDFIVENVGAIYGFWVSKSSYLFVLAVPIEIILTCIFGGAAWFMLISSMKLNKKIIALSIIVWAIGGTLGERYLNTVNLMQYGNGWFYLPYTFVSYLVTFLILHSLFYLSINRKILV